MVDKVWGQSYHPSGLGGIPVQNLDLSWAFTWGVYILGHHSPARASFRPKTRWKHFLYETKSSRVLNSRFGEGWFSTFLAPLLLIFSKENGRGGWLSQKKGCFKNVDWAWAPWLASSKIYIICNMNPCSVHRCKIWSLPIMARVLYLLWRAGHFLPHNCSYQLTHCTNLEYF